MTEARPRLPFTTSSDPELLVTPYLNTIPVEKQPKYPGDRAIEREIKSIIRWNAMMMVARANQKFPGIGGHISTYQSAATLYEVGFNWFFRGRPEKEGGQLGDIVYIQGHAVPGIYARAFLEGRLTELQLDHFRREVEQKGLSSYPHPWLMPDFWEVPTVSMGLPSLMAIYQARFNRYLENRGLLKTAERKIWCFLGDGEMDEPESRGALHVAAREKLDNLIFIVNCNLQRLDGPVRGNGKIIQELEACFRGAGWNVIKVVWGDRWNPLLAQDSEGLLKRRMEEVTDGQYQAYAAREGSYTRDHFFGAAPGLLKMVENLSDDEIKYLNRGGHDPEKVYSAYAAAVAHKGSPTVILAKTIKGFGIASLEGKMLTHQKKKLDAADLKEFRDRFHLPVPDSKFSEYPFLRLEKGSRALEYLHERRKALGGYVPSRKVVVNVPLELPESKVFQEFMAGSSGTQTVVDYVSVLLRILDGEKVAKSRSVSTTMAMISILSNLIRHPKFGKRIVPIVPDEGRTFGMDALFTQAGIYASEGQLYEPADKGVLMYYRESKDGQILEEGITEAGGMGSFAAAATSYATHGVPMIPFYFFYSMFGPQRVGDLIWAAADMRSRGFLMGCTSGRTALNGEGLQHEDGHSHVITSTVPNLVSYHPAFAYELAVIIEEGLRRMYERGEDVFYYITLHNENLPMPAWPSQKGVREGILKGLCLFAPAFEIYGENSDAARIEILASDALIQEALRAQAILAEKYNVWADVWSVTSYTELRREALETEHWNLHHPGEKPRVPYVAQALKSGNPVIAVSDFMKILPDQIARWVPGGLYSLGTDGFGRSDTREMLRRHFEINASYITYAGLRELVRRGKMKADLSKIQSDLKIDPKKSYPPSQ